MSPGRISGLDSSVPSRRLARLNSLEGTAKPVSPPLILHIVEGSAPPHIGGRVLNTWIIPPVFSVGPPANEINSSRNARRVRSNCCGFCTSPYTLTGGRLFRCVTRRLICGFLRYLDHALTTSA